MCKTFFSSDLHLNHLSMVTHSDKDGNLIKGWRPFSSLEEMNRTILHNWNSVVGDDDVVYVLGDAVMGKRDESLKIFSRLNGIKLLIPGNHDYCWEGAGSSPKSKKKISDWSKKYVEIGGFDSILESDIRLYFDDAPVPYLDLCHFPAIGWRDDDDRLEQYSRFIPEVSETYNVHGHVHLKYQLHDGNQIHVGQDGNNFTPIEINQIWDLIDGR